LSVAIAFVSNGKPVFSAAISGNLAKLFFSLVIAAAPRKNLTGDPYFTDGLRLVMLLDAQHRPLSEIQYLGWERAPSS
jgi:hypothetical protein